MPRVGELDDAQKGTAASGPSWGSQKRSRKVAERLARQIVNDVLAADLQPGDMMAPEAEMIRTYGVGRATLREALRLLEAQGLIWVKPGPRGGPVLGQLAPAHFAEMAKLHLQIGGATYEDVIEARLFIEPLMARLAAEAQDTERVERLRQVLEEAEEIDLDDDTAYKELSRSFHTTVTGMSGNRAMDLVGQTLKEVYDSRVKPGLMPHGQREKVREVHRAIGEAIIEGRADDAETLMREHMREFNEAARKREPGILDEVVVWD